MSSAGGKIVIQVESSAEQEEHLKTSRKMLKEVQNVTAMNKENVVKAAKLPVFLAHKELTKKLFPEQLDGQEHKRKKLVQSQSSQTSPGKSPSEAKKCITEEDLTSLEGPSQYYWEVLAERRRVALEESLTENAQLYDKVNDLEEELNTSKQMLEEARNLVEVLTEMLQESEAEASAGGSGKAATGQVDDSGIVPELPSEAEDDL
ncbi:geminin isoform X2 [Toxorhynchites rutilus septentrionalis]|uniref:geminin isoform X2 n=1 Tax=Toxorhynchites rutilus septentrionalis TaxID=329112 RepID=UPI00247A24F6|nr:geminin isoform X2 [Toxorhynchites rutilus septentrionalis]